MFRRTRVLLHGVGLAASAAFREVLLFIGLYKLVAILYGIGLAIWPNKRVSLTRGLASVYERAGELEIAERHFADLLELEPQDPISHWELGVVYEKLGKWDRAAERYEKALTLGADLSNEFRDELRNRANRLKSRH